MRANRRTGSTMPGRWLRLAGGSALPLLLAACLLLSPAFSPDHNWTLFPVDHPPAAALARQAYLQDLVAGYTTVHDPSHSAEEAAWQAFVATHAGQPPLAQLRAVNRYVNERIAYVPDHANWQRKDVWNTPHQVFSRGGDCEDLALLKLVSLHLLGWPQERLLVVIGARAHGDPARTHALLLTLLDDGSQVVLDNQSRLVMSPSDYFSDFQPALAIGADSFALVQAH